MNFVDWIKKYWGNPAPQVQQAKETGLPLQQIMDWGYWLQATAAAYFNATNSFITLDQIIAEWNRQHPAMIVKHTPFGDWEIPVDPNNSAQGAKMVVELTVAELEALLEKHK
jgi:hypothetical protein